MNLWPHQQKALFELQDAIDSGVKNICLVSPTGGGKTLMASTRMMSSGLPTVFYTNRKMLLSQTSEKFTSAGIHHGLRAAGKAPALTESIQLAMLQTEHSATKKGRRELHNAKEVIVDEAHNNAGQTCMEIYEKHQSDGAVRIGLTATPLGIGHAYEKLVIAGTNSELRKCGAHVPAYTFAPDEPDTKLVGKVKIGEGECGIGRAKRNAFAQRVFGRVIENYRILNPQQRPAILFAPGVAESVWFAQKLTENGIKAAHIDGENCWLDGETVQSDDEVRQEIEARAKSGEIKVVCNRFVLREGIDWPFIHHGIFATVFGSLTSYLQAGGRLLRADSSMDRVIVQDHGGNWWRHGSLNANREWSLDSDDRIITSERIEQIREKKEAEPIHCPKCNAIRLHGSVCASCGHFHSGKTRPVLQANGTLKQMSNGQFKARRYLEPSEKVAEQWRFRVLAVRKSKKETVKNTTFAQLSARIARENDWQYPPKELPFMPIRDRDWFRPIQSVSMENLR